jgi:tRNA G18 (ribose-2'-O)-methylase SpoU
MTNDEPLKLDILLFILYIQKMKDKKVVLILHDIRSMHNVGSIFRTADALGIKEIFLTGYTPGPLDRFQRPVKEIAKVALGAEKTIYWEKTDLESCIKKLHSDGFEIVAIEQNAKSVDYKKIKPKKITAFIFGNEVDGLSKEILSECDVVAEIPMKGKKESLNVSVALGVSLFRILGV